MLLSNIDFILFLLIVLSVIIVVQYKMNQLIMEKLGISLFKLSKKLTIFFYIIALFILIGGYWQMDYVENKERKEYEQFLKDFTKIFSTELFEYNHHHIDVNTKDNDADYVRILNKMRSWQRDFPEIISLYTLKKHRDGKSYFIVAPETDYNQDGVIRGKQEQRILIGSVYEPSSPELEEAFKGHFIIQQHGLTNENVRVFAPIFNGLGRVDAVLQISYNAEKYFEQLKKERMNVFLLIGLILLVALILYFLSLYVKIQKWKFKKYKEELEISQRRFKHLSEATMEGIIIHSEGKVLEANRAICKQFGYQLEELIGMPIYQLVDQESWRQIEGDLDKEGMYEILARKKDGTVFAAEILRKKYDYNSNVVNVTVIRDITERKKNEEKIYHMAFHDDLTDLPNRNFLNEMLTKKLVEASRKKTQLGVMFLEMTGLQIVNDLYEYSVGDQLMLEAIAKINKTIGNNGILGRWGGNEFILIFPDVVDEKHVKEFAEKLIKIFEKPIIVNDQEFFINVRIGISMYPKDGNETKDLIKNADIARYKLESKSISQFLFFNEQMNVVIYEKMNLERELRKALDTGEFELYYQPQIQLKTGKIIGLEALIRWKHPKKGMVPPNKFIPIAEETRLVIPINEWVIKTACLQLKELHNEYPHLSVSVNLSPYEFESRGFIHKLAKVLKETNLPSYCLDLEITERMTMDMEKAINILNELKSLGVTISMDDFGTGYSSLSYLKRLPIDRLKIDQTFIRTIKEEEEAILEAIISLGHNIGVKVLAEGVETEEQILYLKQKNCDEAQGYYYAKPLPFNELKKFLEKYHFAPKLSSGI
jgi:diguanylate cyclase (GGDEF)-like protein/PAS domain S-box-containing protein